LRRILRRGKIQRCKLTEALDRGRVIRAGGFLSRPEYPEMLSYIVDRNRRTPAARPVAPYSAKPWQADSVSTIALVLSLRTRAEIVASIVGAVVIHMIDVGRQFA
jgi:hypothetical protein